MCCCLTLFRYSYVCHLALQHVSGVCSRNICVACTFWKGFITTSIYLSNYQLHWTRGFWGHFVHSSTIFKSKFHPVNNLFFVFFAEKYDTKQRIFRAESWFWLYPLDPCPHSIIVLDAGNVPDPFHSATIKSTLGCCHSA